MIRKLLVIGYGGTIVIGMYLRNSDDLVYNFESDRIWVWGVLLFFLTLMFWAYGQVRPVKVGDLSPLFQRTLIGIALLALYGGVQLLPSFEAINNFLSYGGLEVFAEIYDNNRAYGNEAGINVPVVLFNSTRDLFTLVFFLGFINKGISKTLYRLSMLLLVVAVLNSVLDGYRNVLSFVILDSLYFYFYFAPNVSVRMKDNIKLKLRGLLIVFSLLIVALTFGRFSTSYTSLNNPLNSAIHYVGQAPNFIESAVGRNGGDGGGLRTFALVNSLFFDGPRGYEQRRVRNSHLRYDDRNFLYWFGDILVDNGLMGYCIILLILIFMSIRRRFRLQGIRHLFLEYIIWILLAHGMFLNPFGDVLGNVSLIVLVSLGFFAREKVYV